MKGRGSGSRAGLSPINWVLPPLSNSWIMNIMWVYIALSRTPTINCYWGLLASKKMCSEETFSRVLKMGRYTPPGFLVVPFLRGLYTCQTLSPSYTLNKTLNPKP